MSTGDATMRRAGVLLLAVLLVALAGCRTATPDQARELLAAIEQGEQPDGLADVLRSPDAAAVIADAVVQRIQAAAERGLDDLPQDLISPARFSDPILSEVVDDPVVAFVTVRSDQADATWARALYVAALDPVPGVSPTDDDSPQVGDIQLALTTLVMWVLWSHDEVRSLLVEREPDAPQELDFAAFRRFEHARNVAIGVSNPLSVNLAPPPR